MKKFWKSMMFALLGVFALSSCEDVPAPYTIPSTGNGGNTELELTGDGTFENPYTVADALCIINKNKYTSDEVYVKGIITAVGIEKDGELTDLPGSSFGNATYFISEMDETGTPKGNALEVYRGKGLDGENMTTEDYIKVGDDVIVCGVLTKFGSTPEITQGSKLMKLNDRVVTPPDYSGAKGSGTLEDPYNPVAALQVCSTLEKSTSSSSHPTDNVYIRGKVSKIDASGNNAFNSQYGNLTYYISEEGSEEEMQLLIYRGYGLGGDRFKAQDDLKPGDEVLVYGQLINYNGTFEVTSGSELAELNGETPKEPEYGTPDGDGSEERPYNVAAALIACSKLDPTTDSKSPILSEEVYTVGTITKIETSGSNAFSTQYGNMTYYISDLDDSGKQINALEVFRGMYFEGERFSTGKEIKEGDVVVICGQLQNYKGTTYEYTTGSRIVSINGITDPGDLPDQPDEPGSTEGITVDGTTITLTNSEAGSASTSTTIDLGTLGYTNAQEMSGEEISLSDGTIVVFDKGTGATTPKYYDGTKGVRMYANNTLTVKGTDKVIAQILLTCDSQSGTNYVGNDTKTVSFSGNSAILTNAFSSNSGGVQLRVQTITITYAE